MSQSRLDIWTRRRFGAIAGGLAVSAAGLALAEQAGAKKSRHKKKRCKRLRDVCTPGGKRKCCHGRPCDEVLGHPGFFCCKTPHTPCGDDAECCGNRTCDTIDGAAGTFCCGVAATTPCEINADCCTGFGCFEGFCKQA